MLGSSDLYQDDGREPYNSINFVIAHDGFTLADLVSYNEKHNLANGEENRDGADDNNSWNCGVEGYTDDPAINELRLRQMKNLTATLLLSQGVPMICAGDEVARTQLGNNNCYCQDNELSWHDWEISGHKQELLEFTRKLIELRKAHPNLRRHKFVRWRRLHHETARDAIWISPDGREMTEEDWHVGYARTIGLYLDGTKLEWLSEDGDIVTDESFLLLLNAHHEELDFTLPPGEFSLLLTTANEPQPISGGKLKMTGRSLTLMRGRMQVSQLA